MGAGIREASKAEDQALHLKLNVSLRLERNITFASYYRPLGTSSLSIYGWTNNPRVEYSIVENYFGTYTPAGSLSKKGTVTSDGATYDIAIIGNRRTRAVCFRPPADTGQWHRHNGEPLQRLEECRSAAGRIRLSDRGHGGASEFRKCDSRGVLPGVSFVGMEIFIVTSQRQPSYRLQMMCTDRYGGMLFDSPHRARLARAKKAT